MKNWKFIILSFCSCATFLTADNNKKLNNTNQIEINNSLIETHNNHNNFKELDEYSILNSKHENLDNIAINENKNIKDKKPLTIEDARKMIEDEKKKWNLKNYGYDTPKKKEKNSDNKIDEVLKFSYNNNNNNEINASLASQIIQQQNDEMIAQRKKLNDKSKQMTPEKIRKNKKEGDNYIDALFKAKETTNRKPERQNLIGSNTIKKVTEEEKQTLRKKLDEIQEPNNQILKIGNSCIGTDDTVFNVKVKSNISMNNSIIISTNNKIKQKKIGDVNIKNDKIINHCILQSHYNEFESHNESQISTKKNSNISNISIYNENNKSNIKHTAIFHIEKTTKIENIKIESKNQENEFLITENINKKKNTKRKGNFNPDETFIDKESYDIGINFFLREHRKIKEKEDKKNNKLVLKCLSKKNKKLLEKQLLKKDKKENNRMQLINKREE